MSAHVAAHRASAGLTWWLTKVLRVGTRKGRGAGKASIPCNGVDRPSVEAARQSRMRPLEPNGLNEGLDGGAEAGPESLSQRLSSDAHAGSKRFGVEIAAMVFPNHTNRLGDRAHDGQKAITPLLSNQALRERAVKRRFDSIEPAPQPCAPISEHANQLLDGPIKPIGLPARTNYASDRSQPPSISERGAGECIHSVARHIQNKSPRLCRPRRRCRLIAGEQDRYSRRACQPRRRGDEGHFAGDGNKEERTPSGTLVVGLGVLREMAQLGNESTDLETVTVCAARGCQIEAPGNRCAEVWRVLPSSSLGREEVDRPGRRSLSGERRHLEVHEQSLHCGREPLAALAQPQSKIFLPPALQSACGAGIPRRAARLTQIVHVRTARTAPGR